MPRPRVHDLDRILDVAEQLLADQGAAGLSVRGLAEASGVSNGALYHAFGSLGALQGRVWLRAGRRFLQLQAELVDDAIGGLSAPGAEGAVLAVVAAADVLAVLASRNPAAARMLLTVPREQLLGPDLPDELADALLGLDNDLRSLLIRLADLMWQRRDGRAVAVITTCVVHLPTAFFREEVSAPPGPGAVVISADTRQRLAAAVRAVLALPPQPAGNHQTLSRRD